MKSVPGKVQLPAALRPFQSDHIVRLGRDGDGGYLVDSRDVHKSDGLAGLGISSDWSFESDFHDRNPCPMHCYDGSISARGFLKSAIKTLRHFTRPKIALGHLRTWSEYRQFFTGKRQHFIQFVARPNDPNSISISEILERLRKAGSQSVFMKIDIEGAEYRIFDELVEHASKMTALAIELHDCDLHMDRIVDFVNRFPMPVVHVHCNNYGPITEDGTPHVIEMTFSSSAQEGEFAELPHPLDQPNKPTKAEYEIGFC